MLESIITIGLIVFIILTTFRRPKHFPIGPNGVRSLINVSTDPQKFFDWIGKKYGGIAGVIIPGYKFVIGNSKEVISEIMGNQCCQGRPVACLINDRFDGANRGIIFKDGESWKDTRKFLLYHLKSFGFGQLTHENVIGEQRDLLIDHIYQLMGKPLDIENFLYQTNINTIWSFIGGVSYPLESKELRMIGQSLKDILHNLSIVGGITVVFPFLRYIFPELTGYRPLKRGSKNLRLFCIETIKQHKATINPEKPRDFIDMYLIELGLTNAGPYFTEMELEGICLDMLLAADTTVATLTFAILHICLNKDIQGKLYNEIISQVGPKRKITYEDRNRLVYTEAFLMEILRCNTPAPTTIPHRVTEDTVVSGYNLPKDTVLFLNLNTIFMDKEHWGDPENFRPERFITEDKCIKKDEWLIPFGKGKRSCFGDVVAKRTMFIWISSLIQNFSINFAPGQTPTSTKGAPTFVVSPPKFKIVCVPRNHEIDLKS